MNFEREFGLRKILKISEPWPFQAHATSEPWALGRLRCYEQMVRDLDFNLGQEKFFCMHGPELGGFSLKYM